MRTAHDRSVLFLRKDGSACLGEVEFWAKTESKSAVTIDVKTGQAYYLNGTVGAGILVGRPHLMVVSEEVGQKEISEYKLIPESK